MRSRIQWSVKNKINNKVLIISHDLFMAALAWQFTWLVRFNFSPVNSIDWINSLYLLPFVVLIQGLVYFRFNLYKGVWRFSSIPDLWNIFRASLIGALSITLVFFIWFRLEGIPRSILLLYPILLIFLLGGPRLAYRMWKDKTLAVKNVSKIKKVLLIGAG